ncbi:MAG TPA: ATP-dependent metallopeptidase FtsH/Yme1/Tma family protein, partial [Vicinamibacterales bacterium]|nr:ATP-dependent metallopeptidase FtsH/Yme1/Tma family protein [Vicinamibacterales bacterium]
MLPPLFRRPRFYVPAACVLALLIGFGIYATRDRSVIQSEAFSTFIQQVDQGQVAKVTFADSSIAVGLRDGHTVQTVAPPAFLAANASFVTDLARHGVQVDVKPSPDAGTLSITAVSLAVGFLALLGFTVYRTTAGRIHTPGRAKLAERGEQV